MAFSKRRSKIILGVAKEMLEFAEQLSSLSGLPLDQVGAAAVGFRTESYLIREATLGGELIPRRIERPYFPYQGAMVIKPDPGLHKNVVVFDFKSMYPNLMIVYNISFDTYVPLKEKVSTDQVYVAPKVGHRFRKEPSGFYRKALSKLIQARKLVQAKLKQLEMGSVNYRLLDARQRAIKVMTNAAYGYAGWIGARWYLRPVAEATAAWGRELIGETIALAKRLNLEVIYGDTDSVFIKYADNTKRFLRETEERFKLEVETEETYKRILFTEAKKRYAGLLEDNSINIVGLEVARGDWSEVAKKTQEEMLSILLTEESPQKAAQYVRERILALRQGEIPYKELIIWKTLTKPPSAYRVRTPHVEAAKRLADEGWELSTGEKIGYVIVKGEGKLYQRAIPYAFASWKDVDTSYYEEQQIVPSILRILGMFDIKKQELFPSTTQ